MSKPPYPPAKPGARTIALVPVSAPAPLMDAAAGFDPRTAPAATPHGTLQDARGRRLHDLRISVTDRCNFRCTYCMPKGVFRKDYPYLPHASMLSFEEITRLTSVFVAQGVEKIRITGGEPLLRKNLEILISQLAALRTPAGQALDITLTTNASLLAQKAQLLKDAGLRRITVSLDSLDPATFARMNDVDFPVQQVLDGIEAAQRVGLTPLKINMVVQRGVNDHTAVEMARYFKGSGHIVRFIEYMDVGNSNGWQLDQVVPSAQLIEQINAVMPLEPIDANYTGEVAQRWRYVDGSGEIGVISSVTQAFCGTCTRARLSTDGKLFTCLFANSGLDLKGPLRAGASNGQLHHLIASTWQQRADNYSEQRTAHTQYATTDQTTGQASTLPPKVEMSYIGG